MSTSETLAGPLTSTYIPPAYCLQQSYESGFFYLGPTRSTQCFPPGWNTAAYYSPGNCGTGPCCPLGYYWACGSSQNAEITATCCPSGYTCQFSRAPTQLGWKCGSSITSPGVYYFSIEGFTQTTSIALGDGDGLNAYSVEVRWSGTTISTTASGMSTQITPGTVPSTKMSSPTSSWTPDSSSSPNPSTGQNMHAWSSSDIIALAVGIPAIIVGVFGVWFGYKTWRDIKP